MPSTRLLKPAVALAVVALFGVPGVAGATPPAPTTSVGTAITEDGGQPIVIGGREIRMESAGAPVVGLPPQRENVELIGKVELKGEFGNVRPEQIADVSAKGDYAYLNSWQSPTVGRCERGGVFVVDISNPKSPKEVGFIPSPTGTYPGEGSQVVSLNTPNFKGDLLTINNEACVDRDSTPATLHGGVTLIDVTNPRNPQVLATGVGDVTPPATVPNVKNSPVHLSHSAFSWQDDQNTANPTDDKAYTVFVDNQEQGGNDVDFLDITNPRAPQFIMEFSLTDEQDDGIGFANDQMLHDMIVEKIGGQYVLLASYWDQGYVKVDVSDPLNPEFIADHDFDVSDPLMPAFDPPEGNAHQAEFSHDRQFIVAADEDFDSYRLETVINGVERDDFGLGVAVSPGNVFLPEHFPAVGEPIAGDTRFVGEACVPATIPAPQAGETVALIERGTCDFEDKVFNAQTAGYDAALIFNNVAGAAPRCDGLLNMTFDGLNAGGQPQDVTIKALFIPRSVGFQIMDAYDPNTYACTVGDPGVSTPTPAPNRAGVPIDWSAHFDGWGYMHLIDANTMQRLDSWAVPEALDERYALDFGDLSVHETANDPATNLAYVSYYRAGFRVVRFSRAGGLEEVGRFIDKRGNNLWGVHQMTAKDGSRMILASDRDYGLYILRYTGPGAIGPRRQQPTAPPPPAGPRAGRCANAVAGSAVADTLSGSAFGDAVRAGDGDDVIAGSEGDDCLFGEGGDDDAVGDRGSDLVNGGSGDDRLFGDSGRDDVRGGAGGDAMAGGSGIDRVSGGGGRDRADGGSGGDRMFGGSARDELAGGSGGDFLSGGSGGDRIETGGGRNRVSAGGGADRVMAVNGRRDRVRCGGGDDVVRADATDRVAGSCEKVLRIG